MDVATLSPVIGKQQMRPATRQLATKAAALAIFGAAFLILMIVMGISLMFLAVIGGAVRVGLGLGLKKITSNVISGVIGGQATLRDYVELDGGVAGAIARMSARATTLKTYDGCWIVGPNEDFITTPVVNFLDQVSANRDEAGFSVSCDTYVTRVGPIIEAAVAEQKFRVNGINERRYKYTRRVLRRIWEALRKVQTAIRYPHRVVLLKGVLPQGATP